MPGRQEVLWWKWSYRSNNPATPISGSGVLSSAMAAASLAAKPMLDNCPKPMWAAPLTFWLGI
jgi:hypothetical protein